MIKFISTLLVLLLSGVAYTHAQQPVTSLASDSDKAGIVDAVALELRNQRADLDSVKIREVSWENIQFLEPFQLSKYGFKLVSASSLNQSKREHIVEYLVFRSIDLRNNDVAQIALSHVTEGRPCFAPSFSREQSYTYEARRTPFGWVAQMTRPFGWIPQMTRRPGSSIYSARHPAMTR